MIMHVAHASIASLMTFHSFQACFDQLTHSLDKEDMLWQEKLTHATLSLTKSCVLCTQSKSLTKHSEAYISAMVKTMQQMQETKVLFSTSFWPLDFLSSLAGTSVNSLDCMMSMMKDAYLQVCWWNWSLNAGAPCTVMQGWEQEIICK